MSTKKVDIGFDVGIASVGWALVEKDTSKIILHGSRLFETVDSPKNSKLKNEKRRESRSARRQVNRRKTLRRDFIKWISQTDFVSGIDHNMDNFVNLFREKYIFSKLDETIPAEFKNMGDVFYLRNKALNEKISRKGLVKILYWYIGHRGFKYKTDEDKKEDLKLKITVSNLPIVEQIKYFEQNGFLNGSLNRQFHHDDYLKELNEIFKNQDLSENFINEFLDFFNRQRSFQDGPGNHKTFTRYGVGLDNYILNESTGLYRPTVPMWHKTIGRCSIFKDEYRASKKSATSQLFNLINDLVNLRVNSEKLDEELINKCIDIAFNNKKSITKIKKLISSKLNIDDIDIKGFRINKSGDQELTQLTTIYDIKKILGISATIKTFIDDNVFDDISYILNNNKIPELSINDIKIKLLDYKIEFNDGQLEKLSKMKGFSETHSLSYKAMREMMQTMVIEQINQSEYIHKYIKNENSDTPLNKEEWFSDLIASPTIKRSLRETIKILEALVDECKENGYEIDNVVVEMAREYNNKQKRDALISRQKFFESINKSIDSYLGKVDGQNYSGKSSSRLREKIWFWKQQNGKDAYTNEDIKIEYLIKNPHKFDLDHIIPRSQSFDNSKDNLVLTSSFNNANKGNKTPEKWMSSADFSKMKEIWRTWYINRPDVKTEGKAFVSKNKFDFLTTELDMSDPKNQIGFISRNLVDTRYISKAFLEYLNVYSKHNKLNFKVKTINGKMTSFARRVIEKNRVTSLKRPEGLEDQFILNEKTNRKEKNRIWHGHHAEDAFLITVLNNNYRDNKNIEKLLSSPVKYRLFDINDDSTLNKNDALVNDKYENLISSLDNALVELNDKMDSMLFSRRVSKPKNTELFNETVYTTKSIEEVNKKNEIQTKMYIVNKLKILEMSSKDLEKYFNMDHKDFSKNGEKMEIYRQYMESSKKENTLFYDLMNLYKNYKSSEKPFLDAYNDAKKEGITFSKINHLNFPKKLKVIGNEKNKNEVVFLPNNSSKAIYTSMKWVSLRIYKNRNGKFEIIPITAAIAKFQNGKVNVIEEKLIEWLNMKNIDLLEIDNYKNLYKGDILSNGKEMIHVVGQSHDLRLIEFKNLNFINFKRDFRSINKGLLNYFKLVKNILGKTVRKIEIF